MKRSLGKQENSHPHLIGVYLKSFFLVCIFLKLFSNTKKSWKSDISLNDCCLFVGCDDDGSWGMGEGRRYVTGETGILQMGSHADGTMGWTRWVNYPHIISHPVPVQECMSNCGCSVNIFHVNYSVNILCFLLRSSHEAEIWGSAQFFTLSSLRAAASSGNHSHVTLISNWILIPLFAAGFRLIEYSNLPYFCACFSKIRKHAPSVIFKGEYRPINTYIHFTVKNKNPVTYPFFRCSFLIFVTRTVTAHSSEKAVLRAAQFTSPLEIEWIANECAEIGHWESHWCENCAALNERKW